MATGAALPGATGQEEGTGKRAIEAKSRGGAAIEQFRGSNKALGHSHPAHY